VTCIDIVDGQHRVHGHQPGSHRLYHRHRNLLRRHHQLDPVSRRILSIRLHRRQYHFAPPGRRDKYCDEYVCLFLYLSTHISQKPRGRTSPNFLRVLHVAVARSFSDCIAISTNTSGFVDNVIFSHDVKWSVMRILKRREGNSQNYFIDSIPTKFCSTI